MDPENSVASIDSSSKEINLKICLLGETLVGKTAIIFRYINNKFQENHDNTIEEQYTKYINIDGVECRLDIKDTGGQEEYQTTLDTWIKSSDAFLLVFSFELEKSFEGVKSRIERIKNFKDENKLCLVVVGNKCDLEDKKVNKEDVENFCNENKINFIEVSALNEINISEAFLDVSRQLLKKKYANKIKKIKSKDKGKGFCCYC